MHNHLVKTILVSLLIILLDIGTFNYFRSIPSLSPAINLPAVSLPNAPLIWPQIGNAQVAIGAQGYGLLGYSGNQIKQPTASTAKLITALLILKKYPLIVSQTTTPVITLGPSDVTIYQQYVNEQGSVAKVEVGEQISEYQALQAMLLPSANNIADSLAIWAYGSLANYSIAANDYLKTLGLNNTIVGTDASGFLPSSVSTASDLVTLGLDALNNPVIAQIVAEKQATIPVAGTIYNVNSLLARSDIIGIKTGNSNQAGGVYVFAAKDTIDSSHTVTIVGSVEAAPNLSTGFSIAVNLISFAENNMSLRRLLDQNKPIGYYAVPWLSKKVNILPNQKFSSVYWSDTESQPKINLYKISYPEKGGNIVGSISIFHTSINQDSVDLILGHNIPSPPWWWRIIRFRV